MIGEVQTGSPDPPYKLGLLRATVQAWDADEEEMYS